MFAGIEMERKDLDMTKTLIAAAVLVAALAASGTTSAEASPLAPKFKAHAATDVVQVFHKRHYRPARHVLPRWQVVRNLHRQGYRHCRGGPNRRGVYAFRCVRHGRLYGVRVSGWSGRIIHRWRIG